MYCDSEAGAKYISFYPVQRYPHIAILDPRTGELMETVEGFVSAEELFSRRKP